MEGMMGGYIVRFVVGGGEYDELGDGDMEGLTDGLCENDGDADADWDAYGDAEYGLDISLILGLEGTDDAVRLDADGETTDDNVLDAGLLDALEYADDGYALAESDGLADDILDGDSRLDAALGR